MTNSKKTIMLKSANLSLREKDYENALILYYKILDQYPELSKSIEINIQLCKKNILKNKKIKRCAVFASYSSDGYLPPQTLSFLKGLKPYIDHIVVVFDNELIPSEYAKLHSVAEKIITGRHGEYDFGSYKRGFYHLKNSGILKKSKKLIFFNDSCFGPTSSFEPVFKKMDSKDLDFWGATESHEYTYHLQSYFVSFNENVFNSAIFEKFIGSIKKQENVQQVILNYELGMTKTLINAGFKCDALVKNYLEKENPKDPTYRNLTLHPLYTLSKGLPLIKVKALRYAQCAVDGQNRILKWLKENSPQIYSTATSSFDIKKFEDATDITFSIILPTYNRFQSVQKAIDSILKQTHENFEIIIIDDNSSDGTKKIIEEKYKNHITNKKIKYIQCVEKIGVSRARNIGISYAKNEWICYVDSDNTIPCYYLTVYANAIIGNPNHQSFYGRALNLGTGTLIGRPYNRENLIEANYIDLGTFVHKKELFNKLGGFDSNLTRLVDWDLIIRYTEHAPPFYISNACFLNYNDKNCNSRISNKESFLKNHTIISKKHSKKTTITTIILSYNHAQFISQAIESALAQKGDFIHEIIISDDGSTDETPEIIRKYEEKYPDEIRNISSKKNIGISENYKKAFNEAGGEYIAILEGDDYWIDDKKNITQANYFKANKFLNIVFSKIEVVNVDGKNKNELSRQKGLKEILTGSDFANDENLNLIANFSSTMFKSEAVKNLPSIVYSPRINEISVAFYMDRIGKIGFINKVMSVYRLNPNSVWTGGEKSNKIKEAIEIRKNAIIIAKKEFHERISRTIDEKTKELKEHT